MPQPHRTKQAMRILAISIALGALGAQAGCASTPVTIMEPITDNGGALAKFQADSKHASQFLRENRRPEQWRTAN